jgi:hypothetical protein
MTRPCLIVRVSRRAIAVAQLAGDDLLLADGRHLTSRAERALASVARYIGKVIALTKPARLVIDAPARVAGRITDRLLAVIEQLAQERGLAVDTVTKPELLVAYGAPALRNRRELRVLVRGFWPELARITNQIEPYVVDAAAVALLVDCRMQLEPPPT